MTAAAQNDIPSIKTHINQVGKHDKDGKTALFYAIKNNSLQAVDLLSQYAKECVTSKSNALIECILHKRDYFTKFLRFANA